LKRGCVALLLALCAGCIVDMGTTKSVTPPEARTPVPDKYTGDHPPELVECEVEGCKRAQSLDPNLYYCAKSEYWFRYAMNRWYLAFAWDGNWFPVGDTDLPRSLAKITPAPEVVKKSREERLQELEKQLEKLDEQKAPQGAH
jgi:hypothetical protein